MKRIAVLTSGGDSSGMNAAIRAVVRSGLSSGIEVLGIQKGYRGLLDNLYEPMTSRSVSSRLQRGGTFLQTARCPEMMQPEGLDKAVANLDSMHVEGLVVIGGDGSLRGAAALAEKGVPVIGIPASIDNDISFTDMSLGVDTALNNITHAVDCLKDTASSHDRTFVVETMGRNCGYLAVVSAVTCGAEFAIIPEVPYDMRAICSCLQQRYREGRHNSIIMVAEGAASANCVAEQIKRCVKCETRIMVLGHYQRGGSPSAFDRMLGARLGTDSVKALLSGRSGEMAGLSCNNIIFTPFDRVLSAGLRPIDEIFVKLSEEIVI